MPSLTSILILVLSIIAGIYQLYVKSLLFETLGVGRVIESLGNKRCASIPELKACEKLVLHQPSGVVYLACSTPSSRRAWLPAAGFFNTSGAAIHDYVATYDPSTARVTRLSLSKFDSDRGISVHGMDVVASSVDPSELFVYLVNHRAPLGTQSVHEIGADSVIEVFKTTLNGNTLTHLRTVEDPTIIAPNDVIGSADGKSFYFTNDHGEKIGLVRYLDLLGRTSSSVGYCHIDNGCKLAMKKTHGSNGIAQAENGTVYVANSHRGVLSILEPQADNTLVLTDTIKIDRGMDNLSIDSKGHVWAAAFPSLLSMFKHTFNHTVPSPSSAFRFSVNTGPGAFYGEKYKVQKVFEDDGDIVSGTTTVAYDVQRNRLFMHGESF